MKTAATQERGTRKQAAAAGCRLQPVKIRERCRMKLTRVRELLLTNERFEKRNLTVKELASAEQESLPAKQLYEPIVMRIAPEMAYRVLDEFDDDTTKKLPDGSFIVTVYWNEDNWVHGSILSFGEYAEVLSPAHLRETIKEKARRVFGMYQS